MTSHLYTVSLTLALLLPGCAHHVTSTQAQLSENETSGSNLTSLQAIQIARRAAERAGKDLSQFKEPTATYRASNPEVFSFLAGDPLGKAIAAGDHMWVVDFGWGRVSYYPGGDLTVWVDDKTGRAVLAPSM